MQHYGESITDVELLQEMVPQIVHVNPNDVRVALDPSFKNAKPMPEPNITVNPFETKSKTTTTTVVSEQPKTQGELPRPSFYLEVMASWEEHIVSH